MEMWYQFVAFFLPFSWVENIFMKNALLAILLITPMFGLLGTMVVNNKMAFFSDAIGHSALTGIALGVILGIKQPLWSMLLFSLLLALTIYYVKATNTASTDTIIGIFSSSAIALGIVILSRNGGFNKYTQYLIGDILSILPREIFLLSFVLIIVILYWYFYFNKLLLIGLNSSIAKSRQINIHAIEISFTVLIALIVSLSIQWIGILIINSLLILPAAASRNISKNIQQYILFAVLIALVSGLLGLIISYYLGSATGATMVLIALIFYLLSFVVR